MLSGRGVVVRVVGVAVGAGLGVLAVNLARGEPWNGSPAQAEGWSRQPSPPPIVSPSAGKP